jgi:hypothetical protein
MHSTLECLFLLEVAMEITTDSGRARFSLARGIKQILSLPVLGALHLLDVIVGSLERLIGHKRMPYFFVLPNMLIFFIFVLLPLILNFLFRLHWRQLNRA